MERLVRRFWHTFVKAVDAVLGVLHIKLQGKQRAAFLQFIRYGFVGLSGTVLGYLVYLGILMLFQTVESAVHFDYLIGNIVSWLLGVLWNFYWNRKYVFVDSDQQVPWPLALMKTYISYAFSGLVLCNILLFLWVGILRINKMWAPVLNIAVTLPVNYFANKFWAFRGKPDPDQT